MRPALKFFTITLLAISGVFAADLDLARAADTAKQSAACGPGRKELDQLICADSSLSDDDRWASMLYKDRLAQAAKAERLDLVREQRKFATARARCMPALAEAAPPPVADQSAPQPGAAPGPDGKAQKAPDPIQDTPAADASSDDAAPAIDLDQVTACLHKVYDERIAGLERPLKSFRDLAQDAPAAPNVCTAVSSLQAQGRGRIIGLHALSSPEVDEIDELHPITKIQHLRQYIGDEAWAAARDADVVFTNGLPTVDVSKVPLYPGRPDVWVFTTLAGKDRASTTALFDSEADGGKADRYITQFDSGVGAAKPIFIRFRGQPYAVTGPIESGSEELPIYDLTKSEAACSPQ
jgi:uncharacterized protein YecT (DUF1311 family)